MAGAAAAARRPAALLAGNLAIGLTGYSEGVRQALYRHHANTSGFRIVAKSPTYEEDYRRSVFCAAPLGEGWGIRLTWALAHGCIPVLFRSARGARQFFDDVLDYDAFSITVEPADIPKLRDTLAAVPEAARARCALGWRHTTGYCFGSAHTAKRTT